MRLTARKRDVREIHKWVRPGIGPDGPVDVEIHWDGKRLSISGVEGAKPNGDAHGSCGQCIEALERLTPFPEWAERVKRLREVWERWHLNDMRAGCEHQRQIDTGRTVEPCEVCGYKYGSAWLYEEVPEDVIVFLESLPAHTGVWRLLA